MIVPIAVAGSLPASTLLAQRGGFEAGCGPGDWTLRVVLQGLLSVAATCVAGIALFGADTQPALSADNTIAAMPAWSL